MKGQSNEGDPLLANNRHQGTDSPPEEKNESGATRLTSSSSTPGEDETVEAHGEVAGMESALGLLFLQQTGGLGVGLPTGAAPGTFPVPLPRGDITQAITLRISQLLAVQLVMEERVPSNRFFFFFFFFTLSCSLSPILAYLSLTPWAFAGPVPHLAVLWCEWT